jgi:hypothetical protein
MPSPRPCAGTRSSLIRCSMSRAARPVTSALKGPRPAQAHDGHLRRALLRKGSAMPGYPKAARVHHPPPVRVCVRPGERRGHAARQPWASFASSGTAQTQRAASPLVVHKRHWKVHQPRSRRQRSGAIGFRFWLHRTAPVRERPPPASVLAKIEQRGTVPQPSAGSGPRHRAAKWSTTGPKRHGPPLRRALLRQGSAMPG